MDYPRIWIRQLVWEFERTPMPDQKHDLESKRQRIAARIHDFHQSSEQLLGLERTTALIGKPDVLDQDGYLSDDIQRPADCGMVSRMTKIENTFLVFPSSSTNLTLAILDLKSWKLHLHQARANDALSRVR